MRAFLMSHEKHDCCGGFYEDETVIWEGSLTQRTILTNIMLSKFGALDGETQARGSWTISKVLIDVSSWEAP